jgi:hypothetical protein
VREGAVWPSTLIGRERVKTTIRQNPPREEGQSMKITDAIQLLQKIGSSSVITPIERQIIERVINQAVKSGWVPEGIEYTHSILEIADAIDAYRYFPVERGI